MHNSAPAAKSIWFLYAILIIYQILTAGAFPMAKLGLNEVDPLVFAFFRFTLASLIYIPILLLLNKRQKISRKEHCRIFIAGLVIIPINQVVYLIGQSKTLANHSGILFATIPIFLYVLAILFLKEKATLRRTVGIIIAMGGVCVILFEGKVEFDMQYLFGDILVMIAVIALAVGTILLQPLTLKYGAFRIIGLALTYGSIVYFPYGLIKVIEAPAMKISLTGWISIGYMGAIVSVLAYFLWYWTLKYMEVSRMAVLHNLKPIIAAAMAAAILGESISSGYVLGGIIVIVGVILTEV